MRLNILIYQILWYNPSAITPEFDLRRNIPPPEGSELISEEKARQRIVGFLKDAALNSKRFQAFADYAKFEYAAFHLYEGESGYKRDRIDKAYKGIKRGMDEEYKLESARVVIDITIDYWQAIRNRHYNMSLAESEFAQELIEIKGQKIREEKLKRQQAQPSTPTDIPPYK